MTNPYWILRQHGSTSLRSLSSHPSHPSLLVSGDDAGNVSIFDLRTLRPIRTWTAHTDSILTVHLISRNEVITHGRDNSVALWHSSNTAAAVEEGEGLKLVKRIGVNALNFAKLSFDPETGHIAVPNTLDAAYVDIIHLRSGRRIHEAIGKPEIKAAAGSREPIIMSLHLLSDCVIAGYEDGFIKKWTLTAPAELVWSTRGHSESIMSTAISTARQFGISVSADDRIARFHLNTGSIQLITTTRPGKASVAIAPNTNTFVVGGWDGRVKVYSAEKQDGMRELGELSYHRDTVECLAFAWVKNKSPDSDSDSESDEEQSEGQSEGAELILAAGGKDGKISLWKYH